MPSRARLPARLLRLTLVVVALAAPPRSGSAQVADLELQTMVFHEPSSTSQMTVIAPGARLGVSPSDWLTVRAGYEADIVTGASEKLKAGPLVDVVTEATKLTDQRHVVDGGFTVTRQNTHLSASYSYGFESDYRSQAISVAAGTDFFQKNTQIDLGYSHAFDQVCTSAYTSAISPTRRDPLDSSEGCFSDADDRATRDVDIDSFQAGWTQTWTPVFATQAVLTGQLQHGFLANPYRAVVLSPSGEQALENHPDDRARLALALRGKLYVRSLETAFGLGVRGYRDTWDVLSETLEIEAEHHLSDWLGVLVRGRLYNQSEALFWSDDYTGGEPAMGPRGQYWTGDRELSPLWSYLVGGRLLGTWEQDASGRVLGAFVKLELGVGADLMKTRLLDFTWGGRDPDDTLALVGTLSLGGAL